MVFGKCSAAVDAAEMTRSYNLVPSVAVCLAAFNGRDYLQEQIDSILRQSGVTITIFISVDASTDGTELWVDACAAMERNIVVLPHRQRFGGAAANFYRLIQFIDCSKFDYISLADQDDIWLSDKLFRACSELQRSGADAYSSNVLAFWPDGKESEIIKSQRQRKWDYLFEAAGPGCTYVLTQHLAVEIQNLLILRREDVQQVELHDWLFYAVARAHGYRWLIDSYPGMRYRQHGNNQVGVNAGSRAFMRRVRKVLSGWAMQQSFLIADLVGVATNPFVLSWTSNGRCGLIWLALHAGQCRRRLKDQFLFALSCILLSVTKGRPL